MYQPRRSPCFGGSRFGFGFGGRGRPCWRWVAAGFLVLLTLAPNVAAAPAGGVLLLVEGQVETLAAGEARWQRARVGQALAAGDRVRTGADGRAGLRLADESLIRINRRSLLVIREVSPARVEGPIRPAVARGGSRYSLQAGELWLRNNNPDADIELETPTVVAGIRGTALNALIERREQVTLTVLEGRASARTAYGRLEAQRGEAIVAASGEAPRRLAVVRPSDAVQWTIRLPNLVDDILDGTKVSALDGRLGEDLLRAVGLMEAGRLSEAHGLLSALIERTPDYGPGWQALALTGLLLDREAPARRAAQQAIALDPTSASAWIIRGYVRQAGFDLVGAFADYGKALAIEPNNVTALQNQARIRFGQDRLEDAAALLRRALASAPGDSQLLSLRGFLSLAQRETASAILAFEHALQRDPTFGEPHLGLGLAHMRRGQEQAAFDAIATAVLLEPQRSLFLSYWGKMLHESVVRERQRSWLPDQAKTRSLDGRLRHALTVLKSAQQADPQDPTPLFYRSIILRDMNRPGEAIESLNRAVALNDNRGVYRSRFLLDRDLASRNVDLSLLYASLGLNAWAERKALASIKQDYFNFSAHVFYAGALLRREDRARPFASEALLGRILQPANANTFNSFNSYTMLFEQPDVQGTLTGTLGNLETQGANLIVSGAVPEADLAFQAIGSLDRTAGWSGDQDAALSGLGLLAKWQPTIQDNLTFSVRHLDSSLDGDLFRLWQYDFPPDPLDHNRMRTLTAELGYHRRLGPDSHLLAFGALHQSDQYARDHSSSPVVLSADENLLLDSRSEGDNRVDYIQGQIELLHRAGDHQWLLGGIYYDGNKETDTTTRFAIDLDGLLVPLPEWDERTEREAPVAYYTAYAQDIWALSPRLTIEAALYLERLEAANVFTGGRWQIDAVNPRLGLIWRPRAQDTFRLAAFRYLVPYAFTRLDPADIAGVPIFRSTYEGALVDEIDLLWEREWERGFFAANLFALERAADERIPGEDARSRDVTYKGRAQGLELELNLLLSPRTGLAGGYRLLSAEDDLAPEVDRTEHLLGLGLRYVDPKGVFMGIGQTLRFIDFDASREDELIPITDLEIGYELPLKRGLLALQVRNLFDERFNWVTDRFVFIGRAPAREIVASIAINF